jgi:hypothetical protein
MLTRVQAALIIGIILFAGLAIASLQGCTVVSRAPELRACQNARMQWEDAARHCGSTLQLVNPVLERCLESKKKHPDEWQTEPVNL